MNQLHVVSVERKGYFWPRLIVERVLSVVNRTTAEAFITTKVMDAYNKYKETRRSIPITNYRIVDDEGLKRLRAAAKASVTLHRRRAAKKGAITRAKNRALTERRFYAPETPIAGDDPFLLN